MRKTETQDAIALTKWFYLQYPRLVDLFHHSPNEGARSGRYGGKLKSMGLRAGWPDYTLAFPSAAYHGLYIELKAAHARNRKPPSHQTRVLNNLSKVGYYASYAYGFDDAKDRIVKYIINPEALPDAILG